MPLAPFTLTRIPNSKVGIIIIKEEPCRLQVDQEVVESLCRVSFWVHEFPSVQIEFPSFDSETWNRIEHLPHDDVSVELLESGFSVRKARLEPLPRTQRPPNYPYYYRLLGTEPIVVSKRQSVVSLDAFVYNLGNFSFHGQPTTNAVLKLEVDGWQFEVGPMVKECKDFLEGMTTPWHKPTNILTIRRTSDDGVSPEVIESVVFDFREFLSFAWGRHVGIALARGFNAAGEVVYAHWGRTTISPLAPDARQGHWFVRNHAEELAEILPGYWRLCHDRAWKETVEWAIYWWLSANQSNQAAETSILAAQSGLEIMAVRSLLLDGHDPKEIQDLRLPAAFKIRFLLSRMNVPLGIPVTLQELQEFVTKSRRSIDDPKVLTEVRNALTHPSKGEKSGLAFEASQLGMWYLELSLLHLFNFQGKYSNRTVFGGHSWDREMVPWAKQSA